MLTGREERWPNCSLTLFSRVKSINNIVILDNTLESSRYSDRHFHRNAHVNEAEMRRIGKFDELMGEFKE